MLLTRGSGQHLTLTKRLGKIKRPITQRLLAAGPGPMKHDKGNVQSARRAYAAGNEKAARFDGDVARRNLARGDQRRLDAPPHR